MERQVTTPDTYSSKRLLKPVLGAVCILALTSITVACNESDPPPEEPTVELDQKPKEDIDKKISDFFEGLYSENRTTDLPADE